MGDYMTAAEGSGGADRAGGDGAARYGNRRGFPL